MLLLFS